MSHSYLERLQSLGISLPPAGPPAAAYVMAVTSGNTVYLSGHIAKRDGKPWVGKLGKDMDTENGKAAARSVAIDLMATLHNHLGSLDKVQRIVKVMGLVNSTDQYTEQHLVINGCSELLFEVFDEAGKHACVEIELIAEI